MTSVSVFVLIVGAAVSPFLSTAHAENIAEGGELSSSEQTVEAPKIQDLSGTWHERAVICRKNGEKVEYRNLKENEAYDNDGSRLKIDGLKWSAKRFLRTKKFQACRGNSLEQNGEFLIHGFEGEGIDLTLHMNSEPANCVVSTVCTFEGGQCATSEIGNPYGRNWSRLNLRREGDYLIMLINGGNAPWCPDGKAESVWTSDNKS